MNKSDKKRIFILCDSYFDCFPGLTNICQTESSESDKGVFNYG